MNPKILLQCLGIAGCAGFGAKLWSMSSHETERPGITRDAVRARRDTADPAQFATRLDADAPADASGANEPSSTSDSELDPSAPLDATTPVAATSGPRLAALRASSDATAPLPPLAGPEPPRIPEALARVALRFVGRDAAAEALWLTAINDPHLDESARSDLIEDLNDEGYSNPRKLEPADLPLLLARLRIIEQLAPVAMDDVNAAAFEEAYKDLVGMLVSLRKS